MAAITCVANADFGMPSANFASLDTPSGNYGPSSYGAASGLAGTAFGFDTDSPDSEQTNIADNMTEDFGLPSLENVQYDPSTPNIFDRGAPLNESVEAPLDPVSRGLFLEAVALALAGQARSDRACCRDVQRRFFVPPLTVETSGKKVGKYA